MEELNLEAFEEASEVVQQVTKETKLVYSDYFSAQTGNRVWFKPENMQQTGAYKVRGAYYKISRMSDDARKKFISKWQERKRSEITHPFLEEKIPWGLVPYTQALLMARFIRGDIEAYPPFMWK